jgi:Skp family chaperone for outer membrane proteins
MFKPHRADVVLRLSGLLLLAFVLSGCQPAPPSAGGVAVIDLDAVAVAVGRDKVIAGQVEAYAREEGQKLQQLRTELEQKVSGASAELGADASDEAKQSLNTMVREARSQLAREVAQARQSAQEMRTRLVSEFAREVQPVAGKIAQARGFTLVMVKQPSMLAVASEVNITDAVIEELKASDRGAASSVTPDLPGAAND